MSRDGFAQAATRKLVHGHRSIQLDPNMVPHMDQNGGFKGPDVDLNMALDDVDLNVTLEWTNRGPQLKARFLSESHMYKTI